MIQVVSGAGVPTVESATSKIPMPLVPLPATDKKQSSNPDPLTGYLTRTSEVHATLDESASAHSQAVGCGEFFGWGAVL